MKIEVRADETVRITGYVNAVERESRPVITARGRVNEQIESGVFERALAEASAVSMTVDHIASREVANTAKGTLFLKEDAIGLRAEAIVSDKTVVQAGREKKIKGWSFGMTNVQDSVEERAGKLPLRRIRKLSLDHIALIIDKTPFYSATSVELRADKEEDIETRAFADEVDFCVEEKRAEIDYSAYEERLNRLKGE